MLSILRDYIRNMKRRTRGIFVKGYDLVDATDILDHMEIEYKIQFHRDEDRNVVSNIYFTANDKEMSEFMSQIRDRINYVGIILD